MRMYMFLDKLDEKGVRVRQERYYYRSNWDYVPNRLCQEKLLMRILIEFLLELAKAF